MANANAQILAGSVPRAGQRRDLGGEIRGFTYGPPVHRDVRICDDGPRTER